MRSQRLRWSAMFFLVCLSQSLTFGQFYQVDHVATGSKPMGLDWTVIQQVFTQEVIIAVANSGDNTVSIFSAGHPPIPQGTRPVTGAFSVVSCGPYFLATASTGSSITWWNASDLTSSTPQRTLSVGPLPYAAACYSTSNPVQALVSTSGDNSLSLVNLDSGSVVSRTSGVPASRAFHGIAMDKNGVAWVIGTDANVVTIVLVASTKAIVSYPIQNPIAISFNGTYVVVASGGDNSLSSFDPKTLALASKSAFNAGPASTVSDLVGGGSGTLLAAGNSFVESGIANGVSILNIVPNIPGASAITVFPLNRLDQIITYGVTSANSNTLFSIYPVGAPRDMGAANGASFVPATFDSNSYGGVQTGLAPGSLASVFATTGVSKAQTAVALPLSTTMAGVSLRVGGSATYSNNAFQYSPTGSVLAPLLYVGPSQVNFQIPPGMTGNSTLVQLQRPDGTTLLSNVGLLSASPGIFTVLGNGSGPGAVLNQDNSLNLPNNPAARGSVVQIFATGAGNTTPPLGLGEAASATGLPAVLTQIQPSVSIGGADAVVAFSGMAPGFVGVWQINAVVPKTSTTGPIVPLIVFAAGITSNVVNIAVQ
jgi:uncharacterized protein (TIGR03437 family)